MLDIFKSDFFSSLFGAIAGALAAYWLGRQGDTERRLLDELSACNIAIGLCAGIAGTYLANKRQRVKPMIDFYVAQRVALFATSLSGQIRAPASGLNLESLNPVWTATEALSTIISERVLTAFEPASLAAALSLDVYNQRNATEMRNQLVQSYRDYPAYDRFLHYFGLPLPSGIVDRAYPDMMHGIYVYTDDCIYRATLLSDVLSSHAIELASRIGKRAPKVKKADPSLGVYAALLPDPKSYSSWETQFRPKKIEPVLTI